MNMFRKSILYFIGNILSKIITFFLIPIYTKYIAAEDFGLFDTASSLSLFFATVIFIDIGTGVMRWLFSKDDEIDKGAVLSAGLQTYFYSLLLAIVISIIGSLFVSVENFWLICLYGIINTTVYNIGCMARGLGKNKIYAISGVINTFFQVALNIIFIVCLHYGYKSLYYASIISGFITIIFLLCGSDISLNINIRFKPSMLQKQLIKFCLPLGINSAAFWLLNSANRVIITAIIGSEYTGFYTIANRFTQIVVLISTCIQFAWQEEAFSLGEQSNDKNYYSSAVKTAILLYGGAISCVIPAIKIFLYIYPSFIDASYSNSILLMPMAIVASFASIISSFLGAIFGAIKKNKMIFHSTFAGGIVNVGLLFILLKMGFGVGAANISLFIGFGVNVVLRMISLYKEIGLIVNWKVVVLVLLGLTTACLLFIYMNILINAIYLVILCFIGIFMFKDKIINFYYKYKWRRQ
jgi:O-antigen/teichoic acid export membrane protein